MAIAIKMKANFPMTTHQNSAALVMDRLIICATLVTILRQGTRFNSIMCTDRNRRLCLPAHARNELAPLPSW